MATISENIIIVSVSVIHIQSVKSSDNSPNPTTLHNHAINLPGPIDLSPTTYDPNSVIPLRHTLRHHATTTGPFTFIIINT